MRGVATLRLKYYGEYQLTVLNIAESQQKIANISSDSKLNSESLQMTGKAWEKPIREKIRGKNLVGLSLRELRINPDTVYG
jgi:hypothetical protein